MTPADLAELRRLVALPGGEEAVLEALLELQRERAQRRQPSQHRHPRNRTRNLIADVVPSDKARAEAKRDARRFGLPVGREE